MSLLLVALSQPRPYIPPPTEEPPPDPDPVEAISQFMTVQELDKIRWKIDNNRYVTKGDRFPNSSGDWSRILTSANQLKSNNIIERYTGPTHYFVEETINGKKVQKRIDYGENDPYHSQAQSIPHANGIRILNCAFAGVVGKKVGGQWQRDTTYVNAAKNALLDAIFSNPSTLQYRADINPPDPNANIGYGTGNNKRWRYDRFSDAGYLFLANEWQLRLFNAFDLIKEDYTVPQRNAIELWFKNWAYFTAREVNKIFNETFVNRYAENWNFAPTAANNLASFGSPVERKTHDGGYKVPRLAIFYNNRRATMINFAGQVGLYLNEPFLINSMKVFFKETIRYSVFPNGMLGDMYRGTLSTGNVAHETAISYCMSQIGIFIQMADACARKGDFSLYEYTTSAGFAGTAGGPKNFYKVLKLYSDIYGKRQTFYFDKELLDGETPNWKSILDNQLSRANIYYRDPVIKSTYMRTPPANPFPAVPGTIGGQPAEMGNSSASPGIALQYWELEGEVWPYPSD